MEVARPLADEFIKLGLSVWSLASDAWLMNKSQLIFLPRVCLYEAVQESLGRHVALKVLPFNTLQWHPLEAAHGGTVSRAGAIGLAVC